MAKFDLGQASLIHMIRASQRMFDVAAIGTLREVGRAFGAESKLELSELEGQVEPIRDQIVGLPVCPFQAAIDTFRECCGDLPEEVRTLAQYANSQGEAWVSAFCGIHQAMRRQRIGESYQQVACRSGKNVAIADQTIVPENEARELLNKYACLYAR